MISQSCLPEVIQNKLFRQLTDSQNMKFSWDSSTVLNKYVTIWVTYLFKGWCNSFGHGLWFLNYLMIFRIILHSIIHVPEFHNFAKVLTTIMVIKHYLNLKCHYFYFCINTSLNVSKFIPKDFVKLRGRFNIH